LPLYDIIYGTPLRLQAIAPTRERADDAFKRRMAFGKTLDANDFLYAWEASRDYDPDAALSTIRARLLAVNFADDFINAVELDVMAPARAKLRSGRAVIVPATSRHTGHVTYFFPETWKGYVADLLTP